jgi:hypothetical protein
MAGRYGRASDAAWMRVLERRDLSRSESYHEEFRLLGCYAVWLL